MWKKENPTESGWYLTRRLLDVNFTYPYTWYVFYWSSKYSVWLPFTDFSLSEKEAKGYDNSQYIDEWTEIPE